MVSSRLKIRKSQFNEDFIKIYNEGSNEGYFLKVDVHYLEKCMTFTIVYHFCLKVRKSK